MRYGSEQKPDSVRILNSLSIATRRMGGKGQRRLVPYRTVSLTLVQEGAAPSNNRSIAVRSDSGDFAGP
jgi:hypothetical protein